MPMTMTRGAQAVRGLMGEMMVIDRRMAITRKYTLANRLNCRRRASGIKRCLLGKKLSRVYLDVRTKLDSNSSLFLESAVEASKWKSYGLGY